MLDVIQRREEILRPSSDNEFVRRTTETYLVLKGHQAFEALYETIARRKIEVFPKGDMR